MLSFFQDLNWNGCPHQAPSKNECGHASVVCVTDKEDVGGIEVAKRHGIPIVQEIVNRQLPVEERRREQELRIIEQLEQYEIELIVLSGYMRFLKRIC